ncbi:hypothetical protein CspeluHIS016_0104990 [Cutaneotrichosporon spelunceum]|uniref:Dipeptidyl-peptidase V n=1 Tax=Cutaneotrichosporon spelunceum TaxID=1672016 RepID=A0AAD3TNQ4_9TREE|nr:hypothetical protein CspeluHIS016_0104990 [Cutaneotrichosporon spelunceum]
MFAPLLGLLGLVAVNAVDQFTPVDMLSTPRPQAAIASPDGLHAISVVDQWNEATDTMSRTLHILDLDGLEQLKDSDKRVRTIWTAPTSQGHDFIWLSTDTVAYINGSALVHFSINSKNSEATKVLDFPEGTEPSGLQYDSNSGALVFSAAVWEANLDLDKTGAGDKAYEERGDSGLVLDDLFVRHWDTWRIPGRIYTLGLVRLSNHDGAFTGSKFENILKGTGLYSQMDAISEFSLWNNRVAVALKPNDINVALHTRMEVYVVNLDKLGDKPVQLTPGNLGAVSGVEFSGDGSKLAWLQMAEDGYESDKRVVTVHTFANSKTQKWTQKWDRSPDSLAWALDSCSLYGTAEYRGRVLPYHFPAPNRLPEPLLFEGSTSRITPLTGSTFLISCSSMQHPTEIFFVDLEEGTDPGHDPHKRPAEQVYQVTHYSEAHIAGRLDGHKPESLWFEGVDGFRVHAWVLKPRNWNKNDAPGSYPLAFLIHGGPQGAWDESWSTRWNPAVYASAGYFVVAVNPTGSTGYGQEFCDRIQNHWGDRPYQDLLIGYGAALDKYTQIDKNRTVALGASYGGFMVNWINGHNSFGFKAMVYHDGMLSTTDTFFSTEELWFPFREFEGSPVEARGNYERWNPMNHVANWKTPTLVVQGGLDFRLSESMGIATFTALQYMKVESRFLYFPDENHWVLKPHNSRRWHTEVLRWIDQHVGHGKK